MTITADDPDTGEPEPSTPEPYNMARRLEERRRMWLGRFVRMQARTRDCIMVRDIAGWRARWNNQDVPNEALREDTYRLFKIAFLRGEFEQGGCSQVRWLNPEYGYRRLTFEDPKNFAASDPNDLAEVIRHCLRWCAIPRGVARQWFERQGWDLPPWLREPVSSVHFNPSEVHDIGVGAPALSDAVQETEGADQTGSPYKTGTQGRPSGINLIRSELERRRAAGLVLLTMVKESVQLATWLAAHHPKAPRTGPKAIRNSLRVELREAVDEAKARKERPK
jgi:hypothetical protein